MPDPGFRDLDDLLTTSRAKRKEAPPPIDIATSEPPTKADMAIPMPPPAPVTPTKTFDPDVSQGADALGLTPLIDLLAELAAHRGSGVPLSIAFIGGPGTGKSFAVERLVDSIGRLSAVATDGTTPYLADIAVVRVDAAALDGDPTAALAEAVHAGLARDYPDLAREAAHAVRDPRLVIREASDRLDEARRRLDAERRALDDVESRRARLVETVLYETAGSQVDAYARANRARIENRLAAFGMGADPIGAYKNQVRLLAESGGSARMSLALRSLWAFKGQSKLFVTAVLLVLIGLGLNFAVAHRETWLASLRTQDSLTPVATWFQANMSLLSTLSHVAFAGAALAIVANFWRAARFLMPLYRGASLLEADLANRRRDLDGLYAHQTRRVDSLASDADTAARSMSDAERRAGALQEAAPAAEKLPFVADSGRRQAQAFLSGLSASLAEPRGLKAPRRVVVAIDHLDGLPGPGAAEFMTVAQRVLAAGFVTIVAADPAHTSDANPRRLEKWVQVPVRLDAAQPYDDLVRMLIAPAGEQPRTFAQLDPRRSALDRPISDTEAAVLMALTPLAGTTPRAVKRFVNLYRLARHLVPDHPGALALLLAVDAGGSDAERDAVRQAVAQGGDDAPLDFPSQPRLAAALAAIDPPLTSAAVRGATVVADTFSLRALS